MNRDNQCRRGSVFLEFTLVGIPVLFVLISTFEMARGMWIYTSLAHAVREGSRFTVVHGSNCGNLPNQCTVRVAQIASRIRDGGTGLLPADFTVTLRSVAGSGVLTTVGPASLATLLTNQSVFPSGSSGVPGVDVEVIGSYPFRSAICMFWPGAGAGVNFGVFQLPASSRDKIQF